MHGSHVRDAAGRAVPPRGQLHRQRHPHFSHDPARGAAGARRDCLHPALIVPAEVRDAAWSPCAIWRRPAYPTSFCWKCACRRGLSWCSKSSSRTIPANTWKSLKLRAFRAAGSGAGCSTALPSSKRSCAACSRTRMRRRLKFPHDYTDLFCRVPADGRGCFSDRRPADEFQKPPRGKAELVYADPLQFLHRGGGFLQSVRNNLGELEYPAPFRNFLTKLI